MNIETKFEIGYWVTHGKQSEGLKSILQVREIYAQVCSGGVQIFYFCRQSFAKRERTYDGESKYNWVVGHHTGRDISETGWKKYREDELELATADLVSFFED